MAFVTRSEFREVVLSLYKDIQKLRDKIDEYYEARQENRSPSVRVATDIKLDPISSIETRTPRTEQKQERRYQLSSLLVGILTLGAVVAYAVVTYRMWCEMQQQTRLQRDAGINTERAWVGLDGPVKTAILQASPRFAIGGHYEVKNFGHGPALKVFASADPVWDSESNVDYMNVAKSSCTGPIEFATGTLPHPPGTPNPAPGPMGYILFPGQSHTEDVGPYQGQTVPPLKHFWFIGCVAYLDQFKSLHWTRFCVESPYTVPNPTKDTPLQFCGLYNDAGDGEPPR